MRWTLVLLTATSLVASTSTFEDMELPEDSDHVGVRHVEHDSDGHHHGDSDDHHESPDSPCHHHETQICAGHGQDLADGALTSIIEPGLAQLFQLVTVEPTDDPSLYLILHVPIA